MNYSTSVNLITNNHMYSAFAHKTFFVLLVLFTGLSHGLAHGPTYQDDVVRSTPPECSSGITIPHTQNVSIVTTVVNSTDAIIYELQTFWTCTPCTDLMICRNNRTLPCPSRHHCSGGVPTACDYNQICSNGQIKSTCPPNSYAGENECVLCSNNEILRIQASSASCVPGKMVDACLFEKTANIPDIQHAVSHGDSCKTACYDEEPSALCEYVNTNYQESKPSIGIAIYVVVMVVLAICSGVLMDRCHAKKQVMDEAPHRVRKLSGYDLRYIDIRNGGLWFLTILGIVVLSVSIVYFVARGKQGEHKHHRRSVQLLAYRPEGSVFYGFSPLIGIDYPEDSEWKKVYYMRVERHNWQQSERLMIGNLIDLLPAYNLMAYNYFAQTVQLWHGVELKYEPILRFDSNNFHNANLCVEFFRDGKSEVCQSRALALFIILIIVAIISILVGIIGIPCIMSD